MTDETTKRGRKPKTQAVMAFDNPPEPVTPKPLQQGIVDGLKGLTKSVHAQEEGKTDVNAEQSKLIFSADQYDAVGGIETKHHQRLSDSDLRELAYTDPYISSIITTRCVQGAQVARKSESKFDKGSMIKYLHQLNMSDFSSTEEFKRKNEQVAQQSKHLMDWVQNCGTSDPEILDHIFAGKDLTFKKCSFAEFMTAQIRNLLTFGRCGTHIIRDKDTNEILLFRPVAIENILYVETGAKVHIPERSRFDNTESVEDAKDYNLIDKREKPKAFVQRVKGEDVVFFTEDDLVIWHYQKQALFDLRGYMLAPIELAIYMVFLHTQTMGYLRNQFVKGLGTKSLLIISPKDVNASLSPNEISAIRKQFHNYLTRNDNSATMPVLSGHMDVRLETLMPGPKDMEFLQVEDHVVRALCSAFQISPQEMGYGHLSVGTGGLTQANKQEELIHGEERGLRQLLDIVFDGVNDIISECFQEFKNNYQLRYTGVGEDTLDSVVSRNNNELNTTATMSSLWANSEKTDPFPHGGDVPLSSTFHANVARYMFFGEFREYFFKEEGASKKKEYQFLIDPNLNQMYQAMIANPPEMQKEAAKLQLSAQESQIQQQEQQAQAAQQQPGVGNAPQEGGDNSEASATEQPKPKTVAEAYAQKQQLKKSLTSYFECWAEAMKTE
jgi:hypothetical protein